MPPRTPARRPPAGRSARLLAVLLALIVGGGAGTWRAVSQHQANQPIALSYLVRVADAQAGRLDVFLLTDGVRGGQLDLTFSSNSLAPTGSASRMRVRAAFDASGREIPIESAPQGWTVRSDGPVEVHYEVYLNLAKGDSEFADEALSRLDAGGGRLIGSDVFLFPARGEVEAIEVDYELPAGWNLHHPYPVAARRAELPSLRSLTRSVVAIGPYRTLTRFVGPCEIELAIRGRYAFGDDDLLGVIARIVEYQAEFFGKVPRSRYLFVVDTHPNEGDPELLHYFGLHFDASMLVLLDPRTDRTRLEAEPASLCAHEFFHNWLGEQVQQDGYEMNWFVEGITTLYAYRTRLATRMLDHGRYAAQLKERFAEQWERAEPRTQLTLAEAGTIVLQDAAVTRMLYTGGLLAGVAIDEKIMRATRGSASLDDLMLALVDRAADDPDFLLTREALEDELLALTAEDFGPWLDRHVYGLEEMPLPGYVTGR